jgi:hypothetical protein
VATYRYDSYGNLVASTGSIADPFKFAGQYQDSELGLHYLRLGTTTRLQAGSPHSTQRFAKHELFFRTSAPTH